VAKKLFHTVGKGELFKPKEISTRVFDIPDLHLKNNKGSFEFMNALARTDDINIFSSKVVQVVIKERWRQVRMRIWMFRILPWMAWMATFQSWSIYVLPHFSDVDGAKYRSTNNLCQILLVIFAIANIVSQVYNFLRLIRYYRHGHKIYLKNLWNYFDLLPQFLILIFVGYRRTEKRDSEPLSAFDSQILSIICLCIWVQSFSLLRMFEWSGYFVRMIILCFWDVRVFGAIFFGAMIAFGNSFFLLGRQLNPMDKDVEGRILQDAEAPEPMFPNFFQAVMYTYKAAMGDWDTDAFGADNNSRVLLWFNWLLVTIVALIILLNLLIAIVSVTFEDVMNTAAENSYYEKAKIIRDLQSAYLEMPTTQDRFPIIAFYPFLGEVDVEGDEEEE